MKQLVTYKRDFKGNLVVLSRRLEALKSDNVIFIDQESG